VWRLDVEFDIGIACPEASSRACCVGLFDLVDGG
jgi:hypothetical protein